MDNPQISVQRVDGGMRRTTHGLVVKLAEPMKDLCDHWRPCRYIFGLSVGLEFCVVLEDAQSKSSEPVSYGQTKYQR